MNTVNLEVGYFSKAEKRLCALSVFIIILFFMIFDRCSYMTLASISDVRYLSVVICFYVFLINDIYGFVNWRKMEQRQKKK